MEELIEEFEKWLDDNAGPKKMSAFILRKQAAPDKNSSD